MVSLSCIGSYSWSKIFVEIHEITCPFYCKDGCFFITSLGPSVYPLLVLLHVMSFAGYDITSHPLSINETTAFSDGEQDSADFWTLSLHLAEYIFFHSLVVVPILLKMTQVSLTDFSQFWHPKIQTSPHYICFHYFDVPLLKTNTWHFHTSITFNYIQLLHTSTTQNTSTINTMKHFSDAGLKPLWQQGLASIALHAHPVVPQHRGKRPLARRLRCRREELEKLSLQKNGKSNKRQHFNTKNGWVL